ncbi:lipoprotein [Streptomyces sp. NPDC094448]|uniref:lipoprotein n=1 Tax=Streptomyces sp. NPDC094448 TaxID=3366063 RepID=UPI0038156274
MLATGCGGGGGADGEPDRKTAGKPATASATASDPAAAPRPDPAVKVRQIGGKGGICALPFAFDVAADWKATPVKVAKGNELAEAFGMQGEAAILCELDARPSGNTGFIRFWEPVANGFANQTPNTASARDALDDFVADSGLEKLAKVKYREVKAGSQQAVEVSYEGYDDFWEETEKERHLAVVTPDGIIVIEVGAQDDTDHDALLPEYERIKETLRTP